MHTIDRYFSIMDSIPVFVPLLLVGFCTFKVVYFGSPLSLRSGFKVQS
jgi:hypothetical protein